MSEDDVKLKALREEERRQMILEAAAAIGMQEHGDSHEYQPPQQQQPATVQQPQDVDERSERAAAWRRHESTAPPVPLATLLERQDSLSFSHVLEMPGGDARRARDSVEHNHPTSSSPGFPDLQSRWASE